MFCICLLNVSVGARYKCCFCDMFRPETTANLGRECQLVVAAELKIVREPGKICMSVIVCNYARRFSHQVQQVNLVVSWTSTGVCYCLSKESSQLL